AFPCELSSRHNSKKRKRNGRHSASPITLPILGCDFKVSAHSGSISSHCLNALFSGGDRAHGPPNARRNFSADAVQLLRRRAGLYFPDSLFVDPRSPARSLSNNEPI